MADTATTRKLGPRQQKDTRKEATLVQFWAMDLVTAIEENDVERAEKLTTAIIASTTAIETTLGRARKTV